MFLFMFVYGVLTTLGSAVIAICAGFAIIAKGYGNGEPEELSIGLSAICVGVGEIIFLGMALFGWFKNTPR